jgi:eukaryotic-like serine/threonine-protein kinase
MGRVFLARHRRLPGRQVAIKVLQNGASQHPDLLARFRREAEIASRLGHPNIVEVLDFDTLPDGTPFLVMEYLCGESLEARLRRGRLPLAEALALTRQMGSALQAAHRAGVVHRDLKPANVFLVPTDSEGAERVKLLDFGISKMLDSQTLQTQDAVLMGTPQYMAPEQALGKNREVDARTDLFALGCIVHEMLGGAPPFAADGGSVVQVVFRIVHTQPEPLASRCPEAPAHVLAAVERALSKRQEDRHPDVGSFIAELTGRPLSLISPLRAPAPSTPVGEDTGLDATLVPSSTARTPVGEDTGLDATLVPAPTVRTPAPVARTPPARTSSTSTVAAAGVGVVLLGVVLAGWLTFHSAPVPGSEPSVPVATSVPVPAPPLRPSLPPFQLPESSRAGPLGHRPRAGAPARRRRRMCAGTWRRRSARSPRVTRRRPSASPVAASRCRSPAPRTRCSPGPTVVRGTSPTPGPSGGSCPPRSEVRSAITASNMRLISERSRRPCASAGVPEGRQT